MWAFGSFADTVKHEMFFGTNNNKIMVTNNIEKHSKEYWKQQEKMLAVILWNLYQDQNMLTSDNLIWVLPTQVMFCWFKSARKLQGGKELQCSKLMT